LVSSLPLGGAQADQHLTLAGRFPGLHAGPYSEFGATLAPLVVVDGGMHLSFVLSSQRHPPRLVSSLAEVVLEVTLWKESIQQLALGAHDQMHSY
jgi:hypothetical protein